MGFKEFGLTFVISAIMNIAIALWFKIALVQMNLIILGVASLILTFLIDKFVLTNKNQGII